MSRIDITKNKMALFLVCEAIGEERKEFMDLEPDEDGLYDISIKINGKEVNTNRFIDTLQISYNEAVKKSASEIISSKYDKLIKDIDAIHDVLEYHNKLFEEDIKPLN